MMCALARLAVVLFVMCMVKAKDQDAVSPVSSLVPTMTEDDSRVRGLDLFPLGGVRLLNGGSQVPIPPDSFVLCDFYNTMPAAGKAKLANWCSTGDASSVCGAAGTSSWLGVTCGVVGGVRRVIKLDTCQFKGFACSVVGLGGSLPTSIGGLDALTYLNLAHCGIAGSILPSLGGLTGLTWLGLDHNSLTGPVPASFCSLQPSIILRVLGNPGLTCYPSCLSSYSVFMFNKGSLSAVCAAGAFESPFQITHGNHSSQSN